ncbi:HipA family kinase [Streptacidiphilus neutrinimicus]|uniref:HipA family kinase n=1 Tax=Streptacidiphilus neutrinimicus TaxID=105420 RepID=UPI0005AA13D6|nr:HipA family kinase [Streptacidiphilus neutrinimicus]
MSADGELAEVTALDYVEPLRTGGSLPAVVETDDYGTYVVKFHAAAQGRKALVAEVVVGELARRLGLRVPELVLIRFDPAVAAHEPDQEVQDLHRASAGLNLGMDYLPGATDFTPGQDGVDLSPEEAGRVVWFDALVGNVDRTVRNPNLMVWHRRLWLIDHGAALIFHHRWEGADEAVGKAYDMSAHALGGYAPDVLAADDALAPLVTEALLREVAAEIPDEWLAPEPGFPSPDALRDAYARHLAARVARSQDWIPRCFATADELAAADAAKRARTLAGRPAWLQHVRG